MPILQETFKESCKRLGYAYVWRQERVFIGRCDLYKPSDIDVEDDNAAIDLLYGPLPTFAWVPVYPIESTEDNVASDIGRTNYDIALTIDLFKFIEGQEIGDGWLIALYPVGNNPGGVACYITQGDAQDTPGAFRRTANQRVVFAKKSVTPSTIQTTVPTV
jgi:hypothetical protein